MAIKSRDDLLAAIKRRTVQNTKDKRAAHAALRRMGIVDKSGRIAEEFQHAPRARTVTRA